MSFIDTLFCVGALFAKEIIDSKTNGSATKFVDSQVEDIHKKQAEAARRIVRDPHSSEQQRQQAQEIIDSYYERKDAQRQAERDARDAEFFEHLQDGDNYDL